MKTILIIMISIFSIMSYSCNDSFGIDDNVVEIESDPNGKEDTPKPIIVENVSYSCVDVYEIMQQLLPLSWDIFKKVNVQHIEIDTSGAIDKIAIKELNITSEFDEANYGALGFDNDLRVLSVDLKLLAKELQDETFYQISGEYQSDEYVSVVIKNMEDQTDFRVSTNIDNEAVLYINKHDKEKKSISGSIEIQHIDTTKSFKGFMLNFLMHY